MMPGVPTLIRGKLYPSQKAAAKALGVAPTTIAHAIERDALDTVGFGANHHKRSNYYVNGKRYDFAKDAAIAAGVHPQTIYGAISSARRKGLNEVVCCGVTFSWEAKDAR